jgi:hypothetical protein
LKSICEYLSNYKDTDPAIVKKPMQKYDIKEMFGDWEDNFMKAFEQDREKMFRLLEGANYVNCERLLDLATGKVAVWIKDFSGKEICDYFGLPEDLTDEERQAMVDKREKELEEEREKEEKERQAKKEAEQKESENNEEESG